jgi:uncharacterized membrane protein
MQHDVTSDESEASAPNAERQPDDRPERRVVTPAEFGSMMVHFYRGEITRANVWRQRLDATFNWAVLATGTTLSFAYGNVAAPHVVILMNSLLIAVFLFIEARRYRYYEVWSSRVRIIETDYIAPMLSPTVRAVTSRDAWSEHLAEDLLRPHFTVGLWEAVGRRLRRNYIWVFMLLALAWVIKIAIHPAPVANFTEFLQRAALGTLPGWIVVTVFAIYNGLVFAIAFLTASIQYDTSEVSTHGFERSQPPRNTSTSRRRGRYPDPDTTATFEHMAPRKQSRPTATLRPRDRG